jgi:uncharacterized protein (DUF305 family)
MGGHDHGTPPAATACAAMATPMAGEQDHGDHGGTPSDAAEVEFDQLYIDMMLPHHGSIIALAETALPVLTDPRLQQMAEDIIVTQTAENEQLTQWRTEWYGSGEPATDSATMELMLEAMPVGTMDEMMREMDAQFQVETFCAAANPDLAFIQQVIPHHQVAIDASEVAVEQAVHPELAVFAERVITAQQAEIDLLNEIIAEYEAAGTPVS